LASPEDNSNEEIPMAAFYTLLYVAPISAAEDIAIDADEDAMERYPSAWLKSIGDLELVELWGIVEPGSDAGTLMEDIAYASPDGEVMVMTVPTSFVVAMSSLPDNQREQVAQKWQSSELMADWSVADVGAVVQEILSICKRSVASGDPVLQVASL